MPCFIPTLRSAALGLTTLLIIALTPMPLLVAVYLLTGFHPFDLR